MGTVVHPTAIIYPGAQLGVDVEVGPYSIVGPRVVLGDRSWVGPHVVIEGATSLGQDNRIFQFASVGSRPQDLKFSGEPSTVEIGAHNTIREYVTIQPGTEGGGMKTTVGDANLFMASAHVAHDCIVGSNNIFANSVALAGHVDVGNWVVVGGMVGVHQFSSIGDYSLIGAGSMVNQDIPPYCIGQGDRCRLRGVNAIGLKRAGFSTEDIADIKKAYSLLFSTSGQMKAKLDFLGEELHANPVVMKLITFIRESKRGTALPAKDLLTEQA